VVYSSFPDKQQFPTWLPSLEGVMQVVNNDMWTRISFSSKAISKMNALIKSSHWQHRPYKPLHMKLFKKKKGNNYASWDER
jgi:hypothetical protein